MRTRYEVYLDGTPLSAVDPAILVTDVEECAPRETLLSAAYARGHGTHLLSRRRESLSVRVSFMIREYDPVRRKAVLGEVLAWAAGTCLSLEDRPGQHLTVVCAQPPVLQSALRWTDTLRMVLTAYAFPFWESDAPVTARALGHEGSVLLRPAGTAPCCVLQARLTNRDTAMLGRVTLRAQDRHITLEGMQAAPGEAVSMVRDGHLLHLPAAFRTPDSADELLLPQGRASTVSFSADAHVEAEFFARGVWL